MVVSCTFSDDDTKKRSLETSFLDCPSKDGATTVDAHFPHDVFRFLHAAHPSNMTMGKINIRYRSFDRHDMDHLDRVFCDTKQNLQSITLERLGNRETKSRYEVSANAFAGTRLKEINLAHVHLSETASRQLALALALPRIRRLSITDVSGSRAWLNGLNAASTSLEMLCLKNISLSKTEQNVLFGALLVEDCHLHTLRLHGLDLEDDEWIAQLLMKNNTSLRELSLVRNNLCDISRMASILHSAEQNQTLQILDLSENPIGDPGIQELARALSKNRSIQRLKLLECEIWREGFCTLFRELAHFHVREILLGDYVGSDFGDDDDDEELLLESLRSNVYTVRVFACHPPTWTQSQTLLDWNKLGRRYWGETLMMDRQLLPHVLSKTELSLRPDRMFEFLSMVLPTSL